MTTEFDHAEKMRVEEMTERDLCQMIDHTYLKAYARRSDLEKLCAEAMQYSFRMVAINEGQVKLCRRLLAGSGVHVGSCVSFPLGQNSIAAKIEETNRAISDGADEIDYVVNQTAVKDGNWEVVRTEMEAITSLCRSFGVLSKVIFENCYLEKEEIRHLAEIALQVRPDFIKTSTGFGTGGATVEDVALMKSVVGDAVGVKAAGGIRSWESAREMIEAGATRIGCSAGIAILEGFRKERAGR